MSMRQHTAKREVPHVMDALADKHPADVLMRLWEEVEQVLAARRLPSPPDRPVAPAEKTTVKVVRYAYD